MSRQNVGFQDPLILLLFIYILSPSLLPIIPNMCPCSGHPFVLVNEYLGLSPFIYHFTWLLLGGCIKAIFSLLKESCLLTFYFQIKFNARAKIPELTQRSLQYIKPFSINILTVVLKYQWHHFQSTYKWLWHTHIIIPCVPICLLKANIYYLSRIKPFSSLICTEFLNELS